MTQELLKTKIIYNPSMGKFINRSTGKRIGYNHSSRGKKGLECGRKQKVYRRLLISGKQYYEHRMAWLYVYGSLPSDDLQIDHIDGDGTNNRISNLRLLTQSENNHNSNFSKGTSQKRGVYFDNAISKWKASLEFEGSKYTRTFNDEVDAIRCRIEMEKNIKEFGMVKISKKKNQFG